MDINQKNGSGPDHGEDRRRQILRAAVNCFARRGFHPTTMNDISAEAQISVGLIYRYFESKDAVIAFMASEHLDVLRDIVAEARRAPTLFAALEIICSRHCDEQPEHVQMALVADLFAEAARNEQVRMHLRDCSRFFIDSVTDLIASSAESATAAGGIDPRTAAEIIVDSTRGMMMRAIADSSTLTTTQLRERQLAMLRTLWPLLFTRAAPAASLETSPS